MKVQECYNAIPLTSILRRLIVSVDIPAVVFTVTYGLFHSIIMDQAINLIHPYILYFTFSFVFLVTVPLYFYLHILRFHYATSAIFRLHD